MRAILLSLMCAALIVATSSGLAQAPLTIVPGYKQTSWGAEDGAPTSVQAIVQSRDGYLWLGTPIGLFRFDGVVFEKIPTPAGISGVNDLAAGQSDRVWIGYGKGGVAAYSDGVIRRAPPVGSKGTIKALRETTLGEIWAADRVAVMRLGADKWTRYPWAELVRQMIVARDGTVWRVSTSELQFLPVGRSQFVPARGKIEEASDIIEGPDGTIWLADASGLRQVLRLARDQATLGPVVQRFPEDLQRPMLSMVGRTMWLVGRSRSIIRLQLSIRSDGRYRVNDEEYFSASPSAPSFATPAFEDREGNVWIGTELGLVRFRPVSIVHESAVQPAFAKVTGAASDGHQVLADGRGTIYVRLANKVFLIDRQGKAVQIRTKAQPRAFDGICSSADAGIWLREGDTFRLFNGASPRSVKIPFGAEGPDSYIDCVEDSRQRLWLGINSHGFFRRDANSWREFPVDEEPGATPFLIGRDYAGRPVTYRGYGPLRLMEEDGPAELSSANQNLLTFIEAIHPERDHLLLGGEDGLARLDGSRVRLVTTADHDFLQDVSGIVRNGRGETWMISKAGLLRFSTSDVENWFDDPRRQLSPRIFDHEDGLVGTPEIFGYENLAQAADGRLWFSTNAGIFSLDPARLRANAVVPPVTIRSITANGRTYPASSSLTLGPGNQEFVIDFTALSLSAPDKVRFLYKLEGLEKGWIDPGKRRQAVYTNVPPGDYRFRVIAANDSGVWNKAGAEASIAITPRFTQTWSFVAICAIITLAFAWLLHRLRLNLVTRRIEQRLEAQRLERERIARDLHDTLLQGVQGLILGVHAATEALPEASAGRQSLTAVADLAEQTLKEGRDRVQDLRALQPDLPLAARLMAAAETTFHDRKTRWSVNTHGEVRELEPAIADEIARIAEEAVINAARHAQARSVTIDIRYGPAALVVDIRDDGVGLPESVRTELRRVGHFGLPGMKERAEQVGGSCTITSQTGSGTLVTVTVPAQRAYVIEHHHRGTFRRILSNLLGRSFPDRS